jgi:hypothetical protein
MNTLIFTHLEGVSLDHPRYLSRCYLVKILEVVGPYICQIILDELAYRETNLGGGPLGGGKAVFGAALAATARPAIVKRTVLKIILMRLKGMYGHNNQRTNVRN